MIKHKHKIKKKITKKLTIKLFNLLNASRKPGNQGIQGIRQKQNNKQKIKMKNLQNLKNMQKNHGIKNNAHHTIQHFIVKVKFQLNYNQKVK